MTISLKESEKAGWCLLQLVGICYKETNVFVIPLGCGHILKGTNDHLYRQLFSNMNLVVTLETWMKRSIPWKSFFCSSSVFQRFRKAAHTYRWNLLNTKKTYIQSYIIRITWTRQAQPDKCPTNGWWHWEGVPAEGDCSSTWKSCWHSSINSNCLTWSWIEDTGHLCWQCVCAGWDPPSSVVPLTACFKMWCQIFKKTYFQDSFFSFSNVNGNFPPDFGLNSWLCKSIVILDSIQNL